MESNEEILRRLREEYAEKLRRLEPGSFSSLIYEEWKKKMEEENAQVAKHFDRDPNARIAIRPRPDIHGQPAVDPTTQGQHVPGAGVVREEVEAERPWYEEEVDDPIAQRLIALSKDREIVHELLGRMREASGQNATWQELAAMKKDVDTIRTKVLETNAMVKMVHRKVLGVYWRRRVKRIQKAIARWW